MASAASGRSSATCCGHKTIGQIFQSDRAWTGSRAFHFASKHVAWATVWMDPYAASRYYHSVVGKLTVTATQVRAGG